MPGRCQLFQLLISNSLGTVVRFHIFGMEINNSSNTTSSVSMHSERGPVAASLKLKTLNWESSLHICVFFADF